MHPRDPWNDPRLVGAAAVAGALGAIATMGLVHRLTGAGTGPWSWMLQRGDIVMVVAVAMVGWALIERCRRQPDVGWWTRRQVVTVGVAAVGLWWFTVAVNLAIVGVDPGPARLARQLLLLTWPTADGTLPGLHMTWWVQMLLVVAVVAPIARRLRPPPEPTSPEQNWWQRAASWRPVRWWAMASPGVVLASPSVVVLIARQHREAFDDAAAGALAVTASPPAFLGSGVTLWWWSIIIAAALGVIMSALVIVPVVRWRTGRWPTARFATALAAMTAGGLLVRVVTWLTVAPARIDGGDPRYYHVTANMVAAGRGMAEPLNWLDTETWVASALHGPLYPWVLSLSSRLGGTSWVDHRIMSLIIGTATVAVVGLVARRVGGPLAGLVAAGFAAIYPNLWLIDSLVYPEGLFALVVTTIILVAYRWRDRPTVGTAVALGALIGAAALTRGEGLLLGPLLAMPWMLRHRELSPRHRFGHLVLAGVACVAVIAPWTVRNMSSFEVFVPLSTNGNEVFVYANCDTVYRGPNIGFWDFGCQERLRATLGEPEGDRAQQAVFWRRQGWDYAREHLDEVPKVLAARLGRQWEVFRPSQNVQFSTIEGRDYTAARLGLGMYYGLMAASVWGALSLRRRRVALTPLLVPAVAVSLTALYAYGTIRFRAPVEPVLCVLAGVATAGGLRRAVPWLRRRWLERPQPLHDRRAFVLGGSGGLRRGSDAWRTWLGLAAVAAVTLAPVRGLYLMTGGTMEEGFMLAFPERILAGDLPNRDFLHLYGPGSLYILAGWYWLFGVTLEVERTFGLLQHVGIITAMFALGRAWGRLAATIIGVVTAMFVLTQIGLSAMAWNGALALGLWSVVAALRAVHLDDDPRARRWWLVGGVLAGLSLTFRPDLGIAIVAAWAFVLWRSGWRHPRTRRPLDAAWARTSIGAFIGLTPLTVHVALVGPLRAIEGMIIDPVFRLRAGRALPRPPSWDRLDGAFQAIAEGVPPWWRLPHLPAPQSLFLWFFAMIGIAVALVAVTMVWVRREGRTPALVTLGAVAWFALGIVPQGLQRPDSTHLAWVSCVSWPIAIAASMEWGARRRPRTDPRALLAGATVAVTVLTLVLAPLFTFRHYLLYVRLGAGQVPAPFEVERNGRRFYFGDLKAAVASQQMIDTLDRLLTPGERLIVGPEDLRRTWYNETVYYYLLPELTPGTYFMEMDPGLANAEDSPLAEELATADWVILTRLWEGWYEPNAAMEFGPDTPNEVIRERFCEIGSWEDGLVRLVRRCDATPVSAHDATP
jgi:hypothetical protein